MLRQKRKVNSLYSSEIYTDSKRFKDAFQKQRLYVSMNYVYNMAFKAGNLRIVKFLLKQLKTGFDQVLFCKKGLKQAAAYGHLKLFAYFFTYDGPNMDEFLEVLYISTSRNHFQIIDWLIQKEYYLMLFNVSYMSKVIKRLALENNVESIRKIFEREIGMAVCDIEASFSHACYENHVDLAELFRQRYPFKLIYGIKNGRIHSFTFIREDRNMYVLLYCIFYHNCHYYF